MLTLYDRNAPKKPTNLTVNSDLLSKAKDLKINISAVLESALEETLKQKKRQEWISTNKDSIDGYNSVINDVGIFSDSMRSF
jgi:Post-segregation antitoxin (ccd killing mechanism protein) encoded by the F plasmid